MKTDSGVEATLDRGQIAKAKFAGKANDEVTQNSRDLRLVGVRNARAVFLKRCITAVVQAVLNMPQRWRASWSKRWLEARSGGKLVMA